MLDQKLSKCKNNYYIAINFGKMDQSNQNRFGGFWTEQKVTIFTKYVFAYLEVMKGRRFNLIYFDGFAGCGTIERKDGIEKSLIDSVAIQVLNLEHHQRFTYYYLVEKSAKKANQLRKLIESRYPEIPGVHIVQSDCNIKLKGMSDFMRKNPYFRSLCFIDPFGMTVDWKSIACFKDLGIDMWLLVPTGIGVNRLLTKKGKIEESWLKKLELFLGLDRDEILDHFYEQKKELTLFGELEKLEKHNNTIARIMELYEKQLKTVFQFVSDPFPMKNSVGSTMYHFVLATNNKTALKIGNNIIGKELKNLTE